MNGEQGVDSTQRMARFSADTTLEELDEFDDFDEAGATSTPENTINEFDRLLKRYVHMDKNAMKTARKRFAKRILDSMSTPNSYTLHFRKDKTKPDGAGDVPEKIRGASWASDTESEEEDEEEEEEEEEEKNEKGKKEEEKKK